MCVGRQRLRLPGKHRCEGALRVHVALPEPRVGRRDDGQQAPRDVRFAAISEVRPGEPHGPERARGRHRHVIQWRHAPVGLRRRDAGRELPDVGALFVRRHVRRLRVHGAGPDAGRGPAPGNDAPDLRLPRPADVFVEAARRADLRPLAAGRLGGRRLPGLRAARRARDADEGLRCNDRRPLPRRVRRLLRPVVPGRVRVPVPYYGRGPRGQHRGPVRRSQHLWIGILPLHAGVPRGLRA